jgi:3-oxoacyl-(acyl-carrier-protein) synthase/thioester reductase-like protein/acyl carrier protein
MNQPIAIIGIAFEMPEIKNWSDLTSSLQNKNTFIRPLSTVRVQDISARFGEVELAKGGYLDSIDQFDREYFDLSKRDATKIFPEHRYFLMHALRAFYDAGYTKEDLKSSNTGIFYAAATSTYARFLDETISDFDALPGVEATRLANFLDLRGPVIAINTTCSSSLVAAHNACVSLQNKECEMILVGGVKFSPTTKDVLKNTVVMSKSEHCRPFDSAADGLMNGEGAIFMVLKRLEDAERDNDPIHAIIEGSALNHGGARIASLTAPSSEAQKEVITKAWEYAKVDPTEIRFIEAHGTGTILGDPIEYKAVTDAFREKGITQNVCGISSFKGQVGHLDTMAGLAGLLRLVAALKAEVLPVQPNFSTVNEHINEDNSNVKIQRETASWPALNGHRKGGVSSFGLTGTNVHMIVSRSETSIQHQQQSPHHFIQLGESTKERLQKLKQQIAGYLENEDVDLSLFSRKINRLYNHNKYSEGFVYAGKDELLHQLNSTKEDLDIPAAFLLLDLDLLTYDAALIDKALNENRIIKDHWNNLIGEQSHVADSATLSVLFQYVLYKYLLSLLGNKLQLIAKKGDGVLQDLLNNKIKVEDVIKDPALIQSNPNEFNKQAFEAYFSKTYQQKKVVVFDFSASGLMQFPANSVVIAGSFEDKQRFRLYKELLAINIAPLKTPNTSFVFHGLQLPYYDLQRIWPENTRKLTAGKPATASNGTEPGAEPQKTLSLEEVRDRVKLVWQKVLEINDDIAPADDFFDLGGDSLSGLDMLSAIDAEFKGKFVTYEEMYSFSTLEKMSATLLERITKSAQPVKPQSPPPPLQPVAEDAEAKRNKYEGLKAAIQNNPQPGTISHNDILVTGATGLLGPFLVKTLLDSTDATIICLTRGKTNQEAHDRFWNVYQRNFNLDDHNRIKVIRGDLLQQNIFTDGDAHQLLQNVDVVYHAAGSPAIAGNPNLEENINFKGTKHLFDWSVANNIKYFNYISTIGIVGNGMPKGIDAFYETDLNQGQDTSNLVHSGTKLLAEEYLNRHKPSTLVVNTFRLPNIGGRYSDGFSPFDMSKNVMYLKLQTISKLGQYSDGFLNYNTQLRMVPVDVLARCICQLSLADQRLLNTFHLGFESGFTITEMLTAFDSNGIHLAKVNDGQFMEHVEKWKGTSREYGASLAKYGTFDKSSPDSKYRVMTEATKLMLKKIAADVEYDREMYLNNIVGYCTSKGFLQPVHILSDNMPIFNS